MAYTDLIASAAQKYGLDPQALRRFVQIESGGNPRATTGSYMGLLQLSPHEFSARGGRNIFDPAENLDVGAKKLAEESAAFAQKYGHAPDASELYMIHQQGSGGAAAHMANPDAPAWQNMYSTGEGQSKGPGWSKLAIWGNIPDDQKARFGSVENVSSRDFMDLWRNKVNGQMIATLAPGYGADMGATAGAAAGGEIAGDPTIAAIASAIPGASVASTAYPGTNPGTVPGGQFSGPAGALFGALGVYPSNIGGSGFGVTDAGLKTPRGTIGGASEQLASQGLDAPPPMTPSPIRKPLDMRGIMALAQTPRLGLLQGTV